MEICPLSCQQSLGSPPDQLAARGEHGSLAPGMFSSPNSRAGSRDGGSQLGDHVVLCPPAGGKERGQAALPFGSSAAGFSSQTEPQRNVRTLKGSGRLHVPLLCCPSTPPFISMPFAPPLPFFIFAHCLGDQMSCRRSQWVPWWGRAVQISCWSEEAESGLGIWQPQIQVLVF